MEFSAKSDLSSVPGLFDEGSFLEVDSHIAKSEDEKSGLICGFGKIDGKLCCLIFEQDRAKAAVDSFYIKKVSKTVRNALTAGAPIISVFNSYGSDLSEGRSLINTHGEIIAEYMKAKGSVPLISIVNGLCLGANSLHAAVSDFLIVNKASGKLFLTPPAFVSDFGEAYGSPDSLAEFGISDVIAENFEEALTKVREILDFLPQSAYGKSDRLAYDEEERADDSLELISKKIESASIYDSGDIVSRLVDGGYSVELSPSYGKRVKTSLARIGGIAVGVISNNLSEGENAPLLDRDAIRKITSFISKISTFNLSILFITDVAGYSAENEKESLEVLKEANRLIKLLSEISVPTVSLICGRAFGSAQLLMSSKSTGSDLVFAWEGAKISEGDPRLLSAVAGSKVEVEGDDILASRKKALDSYISENLNALNAAKAGLIDAVIAPRDSRFRLVDAFDLLSLKFPKHRLKNLGL